MSSREIPKRKNEKKYQIKISLDNNLKSKKNIIVNKNKNKNNKINYISNYEIQNNSIYEEADYNYKIYNKSISKDKIFFYDENKYNTISVFNYNKKRTFHKITNNNEKFIFNNSLEYKSNLNFSFEEKIKKNLLLDESRISLNHDDNYKKLLKIVNIFNSINKKNYNKINKKINNTTTRIGNNLKNIKKSKFSKQKNKKEKNNIFHKFKNNVISLHNRNNTEYFININRPKNKILKIDKIDNISNVQNDIINDINNTIPKQVNFKMYDGYIMSSIFDNKLTEKDKEIIIKNNNAPNKSMKKINIKISHSIIDENLNINNSKIKNKSINYNYAKINNQNHKKLRIINNYKNKENNQNIKSIYKSKKSNNAFHKIIRKRVVLEEEYMISPDGDKKLLSVKRLDNGTKSNIEKNIEQKYIKNKKNVNINPNNYKNNIYNSLYSSIFKENKRLTEFNRTYLRSIEEDSQIMSNISYTKNNNSNISHSNEENIHNTTKSIIVNPSHIKNKNNKNSKNINKLNKNLDIPNNNKISNEQKINSALNNKETKFKKKLFYNKIYLMNGKGLNKFNKSNNNSTKNNRVTSHTNFLNSNRTSMNYIEDKEKSKMDSSRGIYERISFSKEQPFMICHNEEQKQNIVINNNRNCPNLVNIVFFNHLHQNNKYSNYINNKEKIKFSNNRISIPQPKMSCRLKRSNYKFYEIKSMSIDKNSGSKSTRNYLNNENSNNIIKIKYNNSYYNLNKNNNKKIIYSSMDNLNNLQNKYYGINGYKSSRNINDNKENIFKRINNNNETSEYLIKNGSIYKKIK